MNDMKQRETVKKHLGKNVPDWIIDGTNKAIDEIIGSMTEEELNIRYLTHIAKRILEVNPEASLTGSLMLKLRGIDLGRPPKDIDILIRDYARNIKFPEDIKVEEVGSASDGHGAKFKYNGIFIDVLSSAEEPEVMNGMNLGTVDGLINAKLKYGTQRNEEATKHISDLIKLGYEFEMVDDISN